MNEEHANGVQAARGGWNKTSILILLLSLAVIASVLWIVLRPKEPYYNGKPLSYWLARYAEVGAVNPNTKDPKAVESREAIRHIGTNAIPTLIRMLQAKDSTLKLKLMDLVERQEFINFHFVPAEAQYYKAELGFFCLGDIATSSIPALVDICQHASSASSRGSADSVLKILFPAPGAAVPYWAPSSKRAEWYSETGQFKSQFGAQSNAVLAFSEAIKLDPTNAPAYLFRANAKMGLQDFAGALNDLNRSTELDHASNYTAFYVGGLCKFMLKDYKSAEADFTAAISLYTNDFNTYNYRGLARVNLRKVGDALADFNTAAELSPREPTTYRNRAMAEILQKEYELALADVSRSIDADGKDPFAYLVRGNVKNALKDYQAAIPDFDQSIELNPRNPATYASRAASKVYLDDFEGAGADLEKALQLDPKNVAAYAHRGYLKAKRGGEDDGALADFERALQLSTVQKPEAHTLLGLFQYRFSQWVPALENCRKALDLGVYTGADDLRAYIWLIRAQTGEEAAANRELETYLKSLEGAKTNEWEASIARFFSGSLSESNFLAEATTTAKRPSAIRAQVCESLYYAGMKRKLVGDKSGARELFQKCLDTKYNNNLGYMNAGVEMRALKNK